MAPHAILEFAIALGQAPHDLIRTAGNTDVARFYEIHELAWPEFVFGH
jgi:hypothetical protein